MRHKILIDTKAISLTVSFDKWNISIIPSIELVLNEKYDVFQGCGYIEFRWLWFGIAISAYGKRYWD